MGVPTESTTPRPDWDLVRLAEVAPAAFAGRVADEVERAEQAYTSVGKERVDKKIRAVQEGPYNRARLVRFSDYLAPGEDVFEIGCGRGFVAAQVLRSGAGSYRAIDLEAKFVESTVKLLGDLDVADRLRSATEQNLYSLTPGDLGDASLVICSEVIEHVPDPERALEVIGAALPEGADLLFSVPLLGRLETVWGHLSIFTVERLQEMLDRAGLEARHVEPVGDRWTFVLAGRRGEPATHDRRERLAAGVEGLAPVERPEELPPRPPQPARMRNVHIETLVPWSVTHTRRTRAEVVPAATRGEQIAVRLASRRRLFGRTASGGVALPLPDGEPVHGVRLELTFESLEDVSAFTVAVRGPGSRTAGVWTWHPEDKDRKRSGSRRFTIRPGSDPTPFTGPRSADLGGADRVEVSAVVRAGSSASFGLKRVGWIH
ncbi:class I SAM-dependent methyltransferase [Janibacter anophelis]|uniref:class I SAM-dependent methyltransferase n=1 Tax=Janibacter anophelis TaxID=319054 RepID=UPI003F80AC92